jgi:glycosyltransferase involved in cell wall biosynthesis
LVFYFGTKFKMISIISITKNDISGIKRTINSTRKLRDELNVQHLIIDSSNEAIAKEIQQYITGEHKLEYTWENPSGISNAFNTGLQKVKNEWVWFLNGGDMIHPQFSQNLLRDLITHTQADFVIFQIEYSDSRVVRSFPPIWLQWPPLSCWIPHPSVISRKSAFETYGNFNKNYKLVMDYDFWLRSFSKNAKIDLISIPLVMFDQNGVSSQQEKKVAREVLKSTFFNSPKILKSILTNLILQFQTLIRLIRKSIV